MFIYSILLSLGLTFCLSFASATTSEDEEAPSSSLFSKSHFTLSGEIKSQARFRSQNNNGASKPALFFSNRLILAPKIQPHLNVDILAQILFYHAAGQGALSYAGLRDPGAQALVDMHELSLLWKFSDIFSLSVGKKPLNWAQSYLLSENLYEERPTSFEGFWLNYESDFFYANFGAHQLRDSFFSSLQADGYGLALRLGLRRWMNFLEDFQAHIVYLNNDAQLLGLGTQAVALPKEVSAHLGFFSDVRWGRLRWNLFFDYQGGDYGGAEIKAYVADTSLKLYLTSNLKSSVTLFAHVDSGDDSSTVESETYLSLTYDQKYNSSRLGFVGWGNLTFFGAQYEYQWVPDYTLRARYNYLTRSSKSAGIFAYTSTGQSDLIYQTGPYDNSLSVAAYDLGHELSFEFRYQWHSGMALEVLVGALMPGGYLKAYGVDELQYASRVFLEYRFK